MYLRGSKWNMTRRTRKPSNPLFLLVLVAVIGGLIYVNRVIVPTVHRAFHLYPHRHPQPRVISE